MAELDAAAMEQLRKEMGEKVEIPVPEGMIPVHAPLVNGTASRRRLGDCRGPRRRGVGRPR